MKDEEEIKDRLKDIREGIQAKPVPKADAYDRGYRCALLWVLGD